MMMLSAEMDRERSLLFLIKAWASFFAIVLATIPFLPVSSPASQNLVYCPLQKQWVKRSERVEKPVVSFTDICTGTRGKAEFLGRLSLVSRRSNTVTDQTKADSYFFSYVKRGDAAFAGLPSAPDAPETLATISPLTQAGSSIVNLDPPVVGSTALSLDAFPRPTTPIAGDSYFFHTASVHSTVLTTRVPRGPPFA